MFFFFHCLNEPNDNSWLGLRMSMYVWIFQFHFQKLRNKGHNDCASPDPDDCFGHSPLMDDRFGKLNEESDLMYKRCGVSTASSLPFCVDPSFYVDVHYRRLTRKNTEAVIARILTPHMSSPLTQKKNIKKLMKSLIIWCEIIKS